MRDALLLILPIVLCHSAAFHGTSFHQCVLETHVYTFVFLWLRIMASMTQASIQETATHETATTQQCSNLHIAGALLGKWPLMSNATTEYQLISSRLCHARRRLRVLAREPEEPSTARFSKIGTRASTHP